MNKDFSNNVQLNYPLPHSTIYNNNNNNTNNSKMIKSIPVINANKSMHPLLLPNINHVPVDANTPTPIQLANPTVVSISDNNVMVLPIEDLNNNTNTNTIQTNAAPYTQQYFNTTHSPTSSRSSITSMSTQQQLSINSSNTILLNGRFPSQTNSEFASDNNDLTNITHINYNNNNNTIIAPPGHIVTQPIAPPTFYNKNLPKTRKRQRLGPSCDTCRSRKVRCNAKIEILYEDDRIIGEISDKLSYVLKPFEADELSRTLLRYHELPPELFMDPTDKATSTDNKTSNQNHYRLMKHINKIVLFQPCSSCVRLKNHKRRNAYANKWKIDHCSFSKGLTKNDTNIFNEIHRVTNKDLEDMTVQDFKDAGLVSSTHE